MFSSFTQPLHFVEVLYEKRTHVKYFFGVKVIIECIFELLTMIESNYFYMDVFFLLSIFLENI